MAASTYVLDSDVPLEISGNRLSNGAMKLATPALSTLIAILVIALTLA